MPAPWVNSPVSWRLYQETLLRYEALLCAGSPVAAATRAARCLLGGAKHPNTPALITWPASKTPLPLMSADGAGDASSPRRGGFNNLINSGMLQSPNHIPIWSGFQREPRRFAFAAHSALPPSHHPCRGRPGYAHEQSGLLARCACRSAQPTPSRNPVFALVTTGSANPPPPILLAAPGTRLHDRSGKSCSRGHSESLSLQ